MCDACRVKYAVVLIQENGIIRLEPSGLILGRLDRKVDFESLPDQGLPVEEAKEDENRQCTSSALVEFISETLAGHKVSEFMESFPIIFQIQELMNDRAQLTQWVNDLQSGMYINCVYCGHRYGPDPGTPVAMADVLKAHIEQCPKHPLSQAKKEIERIKGVVKRCSDMIHPPDTHSDDEASIEACDACRILKALFAELKMEWIPNEAGESVDAEQGKAASEL